MKENKIKKFTEGSKVEFLLLRQKLGFSRYIKTMPRDPEKKQLLIELALKKMKKREENDYIPVGPHRRKLR